MSGQALGRHAAVLTAPVSPPSWAPAQRFPSPVLLQKAGVPLCYFQKNPILTCLCVMPRFPVQAISSSSGLAHLALLG